MEEEDKTINSKIQKEIWEGKIILKFISTPNEIIVPQTPLPFFAHVPRCSYLPLVTENVYKHFVDATPPKVDDIWFECNGIPLKWHYPIGVLYDIFGEKKVPWVIQVHFQGFPSDQILRCKTEEIVKSNFFNMLKESTYIKNGDCSQVNNFDAISTKKLWDGLKLNDMTLFSEANSLLIKKEENIKVIPIRIFYNRQMIQTNVKSHENEVLVTLLDMLKQFFQSTFKKDPPESVLIHGISPDLSSTLLDLSETCSHPDNFLYIIINDKSQQQQIKKN